MAGQLEFRAALSWEGAPVSVSMADYDPAIIPHWCPFHTDAMIYSRGPSEEYDRLARVSGDSGWSWENLQPYIYKVCASRLHRVCISHLCG
jgi:hypothetical protein